MRAPVPSSSWLKLTSLLFVAPTSFTGTWTRPKLIAPVQIELGIRSILRMAGRISVEVDGRELSLSNLEKLLYPAAGFTQIRRRRLLPAHRPGDPAAPGGPAAHPRAGSRRRRRRAVLREAVPAASPPVGPRLRAARAERRPAQLHRRRPPDARLAGQPGRARAAHEPVAPPRREPPVRGCARPRSGRARRRARLLPRRVRSCASCSSTST